MKKTLILVLFIQLYFVTCAQYQINTTKTDSSYYLNPIFAGDYPDPSILRDGRDYYIVHSSFDYYPGLLIWHSKDLVNWEPVTHALTKFVGSVWAPELVKFNGKFNIYFPANGTNYVVTANSINGPWSDPIDLKIGNIDPGHIADCNGKRYLYFSSGCYVSLSEDGLKITGTAQYGYAGWPIPKKWSVECFCLEGPKLIKRGEYYYLTVAEGGTAGPATSHSVISARSQSPLGPWENSPFNPIIRTFESSEKWWSKGHGTLFDDANGKWWIVFHGYENGFYNKGRQTLLQPIEWTTDGWFKTPAGIQTDKPIMISGRKTLNTKYSISDDFSAQTLRLQWQFYREYDTRRFQLKDSSLIINAKGKTVGDCSPLLCIPLDHSYNATVEMYTEGEATGGLVLFYNDKTYSGIAADKDNIFSLIFLKQNTTEIKPNEKHVFLRLENYNHMVNIYYSINGVKWTKIEKSVDVSSYNHNVFGGFLSLRIGLCSIGVGKVTFRNFKYESIK